LQILRKGGCTKKFENPYLTYFGWFIELALALVLKRSQKIRIGCLGCAWYVWEMREFGIRLFYFWNHKYYFIKRG
jgi:hypothetical protein